MELLLGSFVTERTQEDTKGQEQQRTEYLTPFEDADSMVSIICRDSYYGFCLKQSMFVCQWLGGLNCSDEQFVKSHDFA